MLPMGPSTTIFRPGVSANRFEADKVASQNGGRLIGNAKLDEHLRIVNSDPSQDKQNVSLKTSWVREWAAKGISLEENTPFSIKKGKPFVDNQTCVFIEPKNVQEMLDLHKAF
jgi:hypothetical protein